ncbi:hypothetical protein FV226_26060 [Methylobacterium sp. WL12]|uniref:DUF6894 family protein n=1 Tax=unclassified Methylobacterium TaxID=2615210 RepID=UPI0011CA5AB4|nr:MULTISPECIES: hypothetical protein [unclassified Methylobacterium]TXM59590.1 hypothetical protein FV229_24605 [Methylobacterium sp. WL120]TXM64764.1 hypothetical protein FV226_26060 [Methylobacterium sp. WL12]TXN13960.1 hypothetical protein FV219_04170 [Methylobacterium sp. WL122]
MQRYYFNIHDGQDSWDTEGTVLPDIRAARIEAIRYAAEVLRDEASRLENGEAWQMDVLSDRGLSLFRIDFRLSVSTELVPTLPRSVD